MSKSGKCHNREKTKRWFGLFVKVKIQTLNQHGPQLHWVYRRRLDQRINSRIMKKRTLIIRLFLVHSLYVFFYTISNNVPHLLQMFILTLRHKRTMTTLTYRISKLSFFFSFIFCYCLFIVFDFKIYIETVSKKVWIHCIILEWAKTFRMKTMYASFILDFNHSSN